MESERWGTPPGYEEVYEVSTLGRVRRIKPGPNTRVGRILKHRLTGTGYPFVLLSNREHESPRKEWMVHRLVAMTFLGPPEAPGMEVCHGDGDKMNPRLENLRWDSRSGNHLDKRVHGTNVNQNSGKTHCKRGHPLSGENLLERVNSRTGNPMRNCRQCGNDRAKDPDAIIRRRAYIREYRARKKGGTG